MEKTITVKQIGYRIHGVTMFRMWGGGDATIDMEPVILKQESFPTEEQIREAINDNGFGCEFYWGALIAVDTLWTDNVTDYGEERLVILRDDMPQEYRYELQHDYVA